MEDQASKDKYHFRVSMVKSGFRIAAGLFLVYGGFAGIPIAGILIIVAEILGVAEEF